MKRNETPVRRRQGRSEGSVRKDVTQSYGSPSRVIYRMMVDFPFHADRYIASSIGQGMQDLLRIHRCLFYIDISLDSTKAAGIYRPIQVHTSPNKQTVPSSDPSKQ